MLKLDIHVSDAIQQGHPDARIRLVLNNSIFILTQVQVNRLFMLMGMYQNLPFDNEGLVSILRNTNKGGLDAN